MNKIEKLFLYITSTLFFLSMFIMGFSSVCHASTVPYIVPENVIYNSIMLDHVQDAVDKVYDYYDLTSSDSVIVWTSQGFFRNSFYEYYVMVNPSLMSGHHYTDSYDYSSNVIYLKSDKQICRYVYRTDNLPAEFSASSGVYAQVCGTQTSVSTSIGSFLPSYPFFYNGNDIVFSPTGESSSNIVIITNSLPYEPSIPLEGHATQPINDPNNFINGSNGLPVTRPTSPTINNYTWNTWTSPSVDTSTVESLLESLIDVVSSLFSWLCSNISGEFQNLVSNLENLFDFLVQGIENGFNKVISSIQGLGTDLYNNFVSLFEPITQQLSYISAPIDTELIQGEVESTSLITDYSEVVSIKDSFVSVFTDTNEPSTFTIPIHLENLSLLNVGTQYIDLSVINPVKSALRTFIWVLVSFGLVVTIIDSIPNYINGGGDE